jgi:uncharacterized protein DUF6335
MAKRKAARGAKKGRKAAKKAAARKKTAARKTRPAARKAVARRKAVRAAKARTAGAARTARKARAARRAAVARKAAPRKAAPRKAAPRKAVPPKTPRAARTVIARKAPALDRARRTVQGDDIVPTPPSSLDLDRNASAARTGRRQMLERLNEHHETSPALTGGDVDADWESAATVGDETPGGDNPTPDQDIVDDIGKAVGVQYDDNEELKGEAKISKRDKHRWELDPASSEDYEDR